MKDQDAVKILNELIEVSEDGRKGFAEAANDAADANLKTLFEECSRQCDEAVSELQRGVGLLGGKPETSGSIAGGAHRGWLKVKAAMTDNNVAVLEEVERGQDHAKAVYTKAMNSELPASVSHIVQKQCEGALRNHDRIRDLRNAYRSAA
jgi:uncharacterized protein (TIGR02284 family)